jgi:hypothetical protein
MTVTRVRADADDCPTQQTCPEWIAVEGRIVAGQSTHQLRRLVNGLGSTKLPIVIASPGGSVDEGYALARFIRSKGLSVAVGFTELLPCTTGDKACTTQAQGGIRRGRIAARPAPCASACVFVLAGGVQRHVSALAAVGVHQYQAHVTHVRVLQRYRVVPDPWGGEPRKEVISTERVAQKTEQVPTRKDVYLQSARFFRDMGIDESIMVPLQATPHDKMHWLSRAEVETTRIATDRRPLRDVLGLKSAATPPPSRPTATAGQATTSNAIVPGSAIASATVGAEAASEPHVAPRISPAVIRDLHGHLRDARCLAAEAPSGWQSSSKAALSRFAAAAGVSLDPETPTIDLLASVIRLRKEKSIECPRTASIDGPAAGPTTST